MVRKKSKRASNPRKNNALTAEKLESSSSPNKISEITISKMEAKNKNKIKQEENIDADEEKLKQPVTMLRNDIKFEDLQTFPKNIIWKCPSKHSLEMLKVRAIHSIYQRNRKSYFYPTYFEAVKTYIKSQSIPQSFYELKNNLIREFGTQVNPAEIHLQLSKTEKTSKETHIEYFYRIIEIASRINMEELKNSTS
ncbi:hypothetical protein TNCV_1081851 [Trichonephila clavipes]|nr:hypothetical protein TNCV_1081851 [Trichonephila clavipes]